MKKTKIVCTLGPSSDDMSTLEKMIEAGMNVARLNFSHGSYKHMRAIVKNLKTAAKKCDKTVAILQDLQGPKIRLGTLPESGISVKKGDRVILYPEGETMKEGKYPCLPVQYKNLYKDVKKGDTLLIDDGYIEAEVEQKNRTKIHIRLLNNGVLKSNKGINCPTASIQAQTITAKDKSDLKFGLKMDVDYLALSFVKSAEDIHQLRKLLEKNNKPQVKIIAKIERHEAVKNLESIAKAADGLMVARGDLGLEVSAAKVPIVQKEMAHLGLKYGKPVIIATQILESMIENPRATRAEISDAANAVFDHADAFMLSGETSVGKYPIEAVKTLSQVAHTTEEELKTRAHLLIPHIKDSNLPITDATCESAVLLAKQIQATAIVVLTRSGYTAQQVSKHRPHVPIIVISDHKKTEAQLGLNWGINTVIHSSKAILFNRDAAEHALKLLKKHTHYKAGTEFVIVNSRKTKSFVTTVTL